MLLNKPLKPLILAPNSTQKHLSNLLEFNLLFIGGKIQKPPLFITKDFRLIIGRVNFVIYTYILRNNIVYSFFLYSQVDLIRHGLKITQR